MAKIYTLAPGLVSPHEHISDRVLIMFPYAGAGSSAYYPWIASLTGVTPLIVQLPGRESRFGEPLPVDIEQCADELITSLNTVLNQHHQVIFFGHSLGAKLAWEVACRHQLSTGFKLKHLIVSGAKSIQIEDKKEPLHQLEDHLFWPKMQTLGGISDAVLASPELKQLVSPILRADLAMNYHYQFKQNPPLAIAITALAGSHDNHASVAQVAAWQQLTTQDFKLHQYDGDHFFINPFRSQICHIINQLTTD